jgi:hypothetical protein
MNSFAESKFPHPRKALMQRVEEVSEAGEPGASALLAAALRASNDSPIDDLTHGFHTYPARVHPGLVRALLNNFARPGDIVLDPFCGSGSVLIEALVAGCKPQGVDLNPLALRIAEVQCELRDRTARKRFEYALVAMGEASEIRVQDRARAHIVLSRESQGQYSPHVLFELSGLFEEIEQVANEPDRRALLLVFSSLLVKFSLRRADTSDELVEKRIRKGLVSEFFVRKGRELIMRWEALYESAPKQAFDARLCLGDARRLPDVLGDDFRTDLVLTSPPYGGTYDYAHQHALRNEWFGLSTRELEAHEIGARRRLSTGKDVVARWDRELSAVLRSFAAVLRPKGRALLWLGDAELGAGEHGRERVPADQQVARLAPISGLELIASASVQREDMRGGNARGEHLLLLAPGE